MLPPTAACSEDVAPVWEQELDGKWAPFQGDRADLDKAATSAYIERMYQEYKLHGGAVFRLVNTRDEAGTFRKVSLNFENLTAKTADGEKTSPLWAIARRASYAAAGDDSGSSPQPTVVRSSAKNHTMPAVVDSRRSSMTDASSPRRRSTMTDFDSGAGYGPGNAPLPHPSGNLERRVPVDSMVLPRKWSSMPASTEGHGVRFLLPDGSFAADEVISPREGNVHAMISFHQDSSGTNADRLTHLLVSNGVRAFCTSAYCRKHAGANWRHATNYGVEYSPFMVLLCDQGWLSSGETNNEADLFLRKTLRERLEGRIIAVLFPDITPADRKNPKSMLYNLAVTQMIKVTDDGDWMQEVLTTLQKALPAAGYA